MKVFYIDENSTNSFYGDLLYIHGKRVNITRAFDVREKRGLLLRVPRVIGVFSASFAYSGEDGNGAVPFCFRSIRLSDDEYTATLDGMKVGLYFGRILLKTVFGDFFGSFKNGRILFTKDPSAPDSLQISVSAFSSRAANPYLGGVIYHIFVDRFAKGSIHTKKKENAILVKDWSECPPEYPAYPGAYLENNTFYGGTLYGVVEKLNYLASLGVTLLYLSPIFDAYSNHKYDTADYLTVDSMFGGEKALKHLIKEADARGIGILLDGVFNHTGSDSIYFNKKGTYPSLGAYQSKDSPYYSWYEFSDHPDKYTCWWGIPILPRIHPDRPFCRAFFLGKEGVIQKYADMGIAGFRLDVADELSDSFIQGIKECLLRSNKHSLLYGEVWEDASNKIAYGVRKRYYLGNELDGVMNYPLRSALIDYFRNKNTDGLYSYFTEIYPNMPKRIADAQMNLVGTHDTLRILTALAGDDPEGLSNETLARKKMTSEQYEKAKTLLKMLYTVVATLPGMPMIYYGDEAGLQGYADPFNRMPYPFAAEDRELVSHYQRIGKLRKAASVYKRGAFSLLSLCESHLLFLRQGRNYDYITAVSCGKEDLVLSFDTQVEELLKKQKGYHITVAKNTATVIKAPKNFQLELK